MLSIIVLSYNKYNYSKKTIQNIISVTDVPHELILVDNGSIDGTRQYLKNVRGNSKTEHIRLIFNKSNFGVAGGRNSGLLVAQGDYLLTVDDDIIVPEGYDKKLIEVCDTISDIGITGVNVEGKRYPVKEIDGVRVQVKKGNLGGGCLCMPRVVFEQVGYYSPDFVYGGEDCDMYERLQVLKRKSVYIESSGKHIDKRENKQYEALKKYSHSRKSKAFHKIGDNSLKYKRLYKRCGSVYVAYREPKIKTIHFDNAIRDPILKRIEDGKDKKK